MARRFCAVVLSTFVLAAPAALRSQEAVIPAGTIVECTLSEPNLSSKTAEAGDPVLCDAGPLYVFGVSVLPRGAYLEGHFTDFHNPGHFWGKGWMQLDFDHILLPGAEIPLSSKVTAIPHEPVDAQGRIHGKGHAVRDTVEWSIPILWPEKIITLPMRGPRPTLKGETRIYLKLMQSLSIPEGAAAVASDRRLLKPGVFRPSPDRTPPGYVLSAAPEVPLNAAPDQGTTLIFRDGGGMVVRDYWFEDGQRIEYVAFDGRQGTLPIRTLDVGATVRLNRQRGVEFQIRSNPGN